MRSGRGSAGPKTKMNEWDAAQGPPCPLCGRETLRFINGACPTCHRAMVARREARMEDNAERRHVKHLLREGTVTLQDLKAGRY